MDKVTSSLKRMYAKRTGALFGGVLFVMAATLVAGLFCNYVTHSLH